MIHLVIGPKHFAPFAATKYGCTHVMSIQDYDDTNIEKPLGIAPANHRHFKFDDLTFEVAARYSSRDTAIVREHPPQEKDVQDLLEFFKGIPDDGKSRVYLHCFAGISRSTATGFMLYNYQLGPGYEELAMDYTEMAALASGIHPNTRIVSFADKLLNRNGSMVWTLERWFLTQHGQDWTDIDERRDELTRLRKKTEWEQLQDKLKIDKEEDSK